MKLKIKNKGQEFELDNGNETCAADWLMKIIGACCDAMIKLHQETQQK